MACKGHIDLQHLGYPGDGRPGVQGDHNEVVLQLVPLYYLHHAQALRLAQLKGTGKGREKEEREQGQTGSGYSWHNYSILLVLHLSTYTT